MLNTDVQGMNRSQEKQTWWEKALYSPLFPASECEGKETYIKPFFQISNSLRAINYFSVTVSPENMRGFCVGSIRQALGTLRGTKATA